MPPPLPPFGGHPYQFSDLSYYSQLLTADGKTYLYDNEKQCSNKHTQLQHGTCGGRVSKRDGCCWSRQSQG